MVNKPRAGSKMSRYYDLIALALADGFATVPVNKVSNTASFRTNVAYCAETYFRKQISIRKSGDGVSFIISERDTKQFDNSRPY